MDVTADWYWEGNVVDTIARFLAQDGWTIVGKADTHTKERGVDIQASKDGRTLLLEAKGYPSKNYRDPRRSGEAKPTNPTNQAQQWYSHALLKVYIIQPYREQEICARGCQEALGHECQCSCMRANHGMGNHSSWFEVSDTFSTRWGERELTCRLLTAR